MIIYQLTDCWMPNWSIQIADMVYIEITPYGMYTITQYIVW